MPTTTNFGWTTPADTDLVKDGAAAIRTVAGNIDTSLVDLKGGTTGQYLQKNSNTDLDYVWATVSAGGMTLISTTTLTGSAINLTSIPGTYNDLRLVIRQFLPATDQIDLRIRINSVSTATYTAGLSSGQNLNTTFGVAAIEDILTDADNGTTQGLAIIDFPDYANSATWKIIHNIGISNNHTTTTNANINWQTFFHNQTAAISTINLFPSSGNFTSGTALLYGVK